MTAHRVFLSHSKLDRQWTLALRDHLQSAGLEVFVDERDIDPGQDWLQRIKVEVDRADWLFFVVSPEAVASEWCRKEVNAFEARMTREKLHGRIQVFLRAEAPLDGFLSLAQHSREELSPQNYDDYVRKVVGVVAAQGATVALPREPLANPHWHEAARLPAPVRAQQQHLIETILKSPYARLALCNVLRLEEATLPEQTFQGPQLANALLVFWTKRQNLQPLAAAQELLQLLGSKNLLADPQLTKQAELLQQALATVQPTRATGPSPFAGYLREVALDCRDLLLERLRPGDWKADATAGSERDEQAHRLLDEVFVELDVRTRGVQQPASSRLLPAPLSERDILLWRRSAGPSSTLLISDRHAIEDSEVIGDGATIHRELVAFGSKPWLERVDKLRSQTHPHVVTVLTGPSISLDALVELDPEFHPDLHGRYVVRGHPGTGKSTALRALARRLARCGDRRIPVLVTLTELAKARRSLVDDLRLRYESRCDLTTVQHELNLDGRNLLLLCDGLDEVVDPQQRAWIIDQLRSWANRYQHARIVVTTRKIGYQPFAPGQFTDLDLRELTGDKQRELLHNWFHTGPQQGRAGDLVDRVMRDLDAGGPSFAELREVPLLLTFVAMLYEANANEQGFRITGTRPDLYAAILGYLIEERHRRPAQGIQPVDGAREALRRLAYYVTEHEDRVVSRSELESVLSSCWREPTFQAVALRWNDAEQRPDPLAFLQKLAGITGILGHTGPDRADAPWSFWHKTLREALAAECMTQLPPAKVWEQAKAAGAGGDGERWAEPLALFVSRAKASERDRLMLALREANPALALRALASVEGLQPETVLAVLQLADGDRDELCRQILLLPTGRIRDSKRAAEALGQLAAGSADTMVLWHIGEALRQLLEREPGVGDVVRRAEARFFERRDVFGPRIDPDSLKIPGKTGSFWVPVPRGTSFLFGTQGVEGRMANEGPQRTGTIAQSFSIAAVPITNTMWQQFLVARDDEEAPYGADAPVTKVDWYDATMYCRWLGVRLPSEAEWECAARAGTTTRFSFGNGTAKLNGHAWYDGNSDSSAKAVATKKPNPWGLYDVHGNVWQWCADAWCDTHEGNPADGSARIGTGAADRVVRGAGWPDSARYCHSAVRRWGGPDYRDVYLGFRLARSSPDDLTP